MKKYLFMKPMHNHKVCFLLPQGLADGAGPMYGMWDQIVGGFAAGLAKENYFESSGYPGKLCLLFQCGSKKSLDS